MNRIMFVALFGYIFGTSEDGLEVAKEFLSIVQDELVQHYREEQVTKYLEPFYRMIEEFSKVH